MKFTILLITMFTLSFGLYGCGESMADSDDSNQSMKGKKSKMMLETIAGIAYHVCPQSSYTYIQYTASGPNSPHGQCVGNEGEVACYCEIVKKQGNTFESFAFSSIKREDCEKEFLKILTAKHHCTQYNHSEKPQLFYESEINFGEDLPDDLKDQVFQ